MIAVRTLVYFILTSLLNAILGVILVLLIHPGDSGLKESIAPSTQARAVNILDSLLDLGRYSQFFGQIGLISNSDFFFASMFLCPTHLLM